MYSYKHIADKKVLDIFSIKKSANVRETMQRIADFTRKHLQADLINIYEYDKYHQQ